MNNNHSMYSFIYLNLIACISILVNVNLSSLKTITFRESLSGYKSTAFIMLLYVPFTEECIFRVVIPQIIRDIGFTHVCLTSSILFALSHSANYRFVNFYSVSCQIVMTFFMGIINYQTGSFYTGLLYHMYYNMITITSLVLYMLVRDTYFSVPDNDDMCDLHDDCVCCVRNRTSSVPLIEPSLIESFDEPDNNQRLIEQPEIVAEYNRMSRQMDRQESDGL